MKVFRRCGGECHCCGRALSLVPAKTYPGHRCFPDTPTVDHVIPLSSGGENRIWNLVLACHACNDERGNAPAAGRPRAHLGRPCDERIAALERGPNLTAPDLADIR